MNPIETNLTCNNELNKMKFVESDGIETMVQSNDNLEEIYEPIVCSLRHVTNRNNCSFQAQETVQENIKLMNTGENVENFT